MTKSVDDNNPVTTKNSNDTLIPSPYLHPVQFRGTLSDKNGSTSLKKELICETPNNDRNPIKDLKIF